MTTRIALLVILVLALVFVPGTMADVIPFSGSGSSGTIDPGVSWTLLPAIDQSPQNSVWGVPGYQQGVLLWPSPTFGATDFHVTFTDLPQGVTIDNAPPNGCVGQGLVMCSVEGGANLWTSVLNGPNSVSFFAPSGVVMVQFDQFFVNIPFNAPLDHVTFTGEWTQSAAIPEPGSLALFGTGLLGLAGTLRRKFLG